MSALDDELADRYRRDGVTWPIRVLDEDEAARFRGSAEALEQALGGNPRTVEVRQMHLHFRWAYELALNSRVCDAVERVLGPNVLVWATELFAKRARDPDLFIAWHRDRRYMGFEPHQGVTAWVALTPSSRDNGCLQVALEPSAVRGEACRATPRKGAAPPTEALDVVLAPGEMSLHDGSVHHGSGPNLSGVKRMGFAIRFISPEARPMGETLRVVVARGHDPYGHFRLAPPPEETSLEVAVAGLRESARIHLDAMLYNLKVPSQSRAPQTDGGPDDNR